MGDAARDATELPPSEAAAFKKLCKAHDEHDYRRGLSIAEGIMVKAPNCSDVIALKGLCLYGDRQVAEALDVIKKGIGRNAKSAALWHALGIYHRSEGDFKESLKCFKIAYKLDGDRQGHAFVRDLSAMAIQQRDWETYGDVRQKALAKKPNVRFNWIAHATAQHKLGNYELAYGVMDVMGQVVGWGDNMIEQGQAHAYRAELALLCKKPKLSIEILTKNEQNVPDRVLTLLAKAYSMIGNKKKAEEKLTEIYELELNERDTLFEIAASRGIASGKDVRGARHPPKVDVAFVALLDQFSEQFPRSDAPRRLALDYCPIEALEQRIRAYCIPLIVKTVPSLTSVLKSLYKSSDRVEVVERVFLQWEQALLQGDGSAFGDSGLPDGRPNPLWLAWVLQFLSSHYLRLKNFAKAHEYINRAIEHTPTIEMFYIHQAKIYHREGNFTEAAHCADIGRRLDLQDKYINGKAAKYYLRAGNIEAAEALLALFQKASEINETWLNMVDMQTAWYEVELGDAYMQRGDVLSALKAYYLVEKHLKDNHDELLDYHAYTLRRGNILPWLDVIKNDDEAHENRFFLRAAPRIIRALIRVHELGEEAVRAAYRPRPDVSAEAKTSDERKRLEKMMKEADVQVDLKNPLATCQPYLAALQAHAGNDPSTHALTVEVALLLNRPLVAYKAIVMLRKKSYINEADAAAVKLEQWRSAHHLEVPQQVAEVLRWVVSS